MQKVHCVIASHYNLYATVVIKYKQGLINQQ